MANPPQLSDEDFAELQKLSNEFEPEATVCMISLFLCFFTIHSDVDLIVHTLYVQRCTLHV